MPANGRTQPIWAQLPFASGAVPLVRRSATAGCAETFEPALPCGRARRLAGLGAAHPARHGADAVERADQPGLAAGEVARRGAAQLHGARQLDQQRPRDPGQDRRVVRAPRTGSPPPTTAGSCRRPRAGARRRRRSPPRRRREAAARSRRAASRSRSGPLRRGARRGSGTSAIQATTVGSRGGAGRTRKASSPSARSSTRGNQRPWAGTARSTSARNACVSTPQAAEKRAQWRSSALTRPSTTSHESAASSSVICARARAGRRACPRPPRARRAPSAASRRARRPDPRRRRSPRPTRSGGRGATRRACG